MSEENQEENTETPVNPTDCPPETDGKIYIRVKTKCYAGSNCGVPQYTEAFQFVEIDKPVAPAPTPETPHSIAPESEEWLEVSTSGDDPVPQTTGLTEKARCLMSQLCAMGWEVTVPATVNLGLWTDVAGEGMEPLRVVPSSEVPYSGNADGMSTSDGITQSVGGSKKFYNERARFYLPKPDDGSCLKWVRIGVTPCGYMEDGHTLLVTFRPSTTAFHAASDLVEVSYNEESSNSHSMIAEVLTDASGDCYFELNMNVKAIQDTRDGSGLGDLSNLGEIEWYLNGKVTIRQFIVNPACKCGCNG